MKRHPLRSLVLFALLAFGLLRLGALSCGAASPPAGIPAPVSNLMSVGNPDGSGTVTVTGASGAVSPGAEVSGDNISGPVTLRNDWIRSAWADTEALSSTTIAGTDGSFQLRLTATVGDTLRLTQSLDNETSKPTQVQVSGNVVGLDAKPQGLGIDALTHQAYVTGSQDSTGLVFSLPLNSVNPLLSSPPATFTLQGKGGIGDVEVDEDMGKVFAVSPMQNSFVRFPFSTEMSVADLTVSSPLDIDISQTFNLAVIGLADTSASISLFDTVGEKFTCDYLIPSPSGAPHVATPLVKTENNNTENLQLIAVSQYQDDSWVVSRIVFSGCASGFTVTSQVVLPSSVVPQGLAVFDSGSFALVTDGAGNQLFLVDLNAKSVRATVGVGKNPIGVDVNASNNRAYVVNSGDNSITSVDLQDLSTHTQGPYGLNPTEIAIDSGLSVGVILSTVDKSTVLVNVDF